MSGILDHVAHLSQEIGPRPAGTEEEQQAALYINDFLHDEAGLEPAIEEFTGQSGYEAPRVVCAAVTIVITALSVFLPILAIPAIVLTIASALLMAAEVSGRPIISKLFSRSVSQNVVASYCPPAADDAPQRRRKVVLVARYDSGKVRAEVSGAAVKVYPTLNKASYAAMLFVPVFLIVRYGLFLYASGVAAIVLNVITVVALLAVALPVILAILHKTAPFNDAANCNASGVAVLLDVAARLGQGRPDYSASYDTEAADPVIHGEEAAFAAGVVPEGASLIYDIPAAGAEADPAASAAAMPGAADAQAVAAAGEYDPNDGLLAAKAAIAALTGKPVPLTSSLPPRTAAAAGAAAAGGAAAGAAAAGMAGSVAAAGRPDDSVANDGSAALPADMEVLGGSLGAAAAAAGHGAAPADGAPGFPPAGDGAAGVFAEGGEPDASRGDSAQPGEGTAPDAEPLSADEGNVGSYTNVPDWFRTAQQKAKRTGTDASAPVRSRYADALDAALGASASHFAEANASVEAALEDQLRQMREGIMEVKAPQFDSDRPTEAPSEEPAAGLDGFGEAARIAASYDASPDATGRLADEAAFAVPAEPAAPAEPDDAAGAAGADFGGFDIVVQDRASAWGDDQSTAGFAPVSADDAAVQAAEAPDAPMAHDDADGSPRRLRALRATLPSLSGTITAQPPAEEAVSSAAAARQSLRSAIPSLSGAIARPVSPDAEADGAALFAEDAGLADDRTRVFNVIPGGKGAGAEVADPFAPSGMYDDYDEAYDDEADGFQYAAADAPYDEGHAADEGADALDDGYVEVPSSRAGRFFGRFRKGKKKQRKEVSTQEWLDVDDDFDAREVGRARGGWESFRDDSFAGEAFADDGYDDGLDASEPRKATRRGSRRWEGGAFSRLRMGRKSAPVEDEGLAGGVDGEGQDAYGQDYGYADAYDDYGYDSVYDDDLAADMSAAADYEADLIQQFRLADVNTEVWFVALGSELANHSGMKAFLADHANELRGALFVDLDGVGAGDLAIVQREGDVRTVQVSSRMKRYAKKASQYAGVPLGSVSLLWEDSAASYAIKQGYQAVHVVGSNGSKPAYYAQADDVADNVEESKLSDCATFIVELLKSV